ncbi:hypothetical protein J6E39_08620 [bacterium]|nr:hypothetical protein [bacterium]
MEVKRTTPIAFGRLRPVEAKATKSFAVLLNNTAKDAYKAEKGLDKFIKKHIKETNYDIAYTKDKNNQYAFVVINNQNEKIVNKYPADAKCPSGFERATKFLTSSLNEIKQRKKEGTISKQEIIKDSISSVWKFALRVIKSEFDKTEVLPSGMRAAGYRASHLETFSK